MLDFIKNFQTGFERSSKKIFSIFAL